MRILVDWRRSLGDEHTRKMSQAHHLSLELIPGGAERRPARGPGQGTARDSPTPRHRRKDPPARRRKTDRRPERIYQRKSPYKELNALVAATGTGLLVLKGIGPSGAARLLVEAGDITRFPDNNHVGSWTGTAPIDASSGDNVRHGLSRGGNRQINRVLHIMAVVQLATPPRAAPTSTAPKPAARPQ